MSKQTAAVLLALWCALVIVPALVVTVVLDVQPGIESDSGPVVLAWIICYLLQGVVFVWVAMKTGYTGFIGWFAAFLLAWVADWVAPVSLWALLAPGAVAVGLSYWLYRRMSRRDDLRANGIPAVGVVLAVQKPLMNVVINNVYIRRTLRLRVERSDEVPPYEAKFKGTFIIGETPDRGDVLRLRVDPKDPNRLEAVGAEESTTPPEPGLVDQLRELAELHGQGSLTDAEFAAAKRRLLNG